ncbi:hypothetical protein T265_06056 [Opisthorchis viverrini]|uniref:Uncharacterized protein n=1 Tax=Opisthorchis viverrini TaxID=6198 RepID=A0A075AEJ3_OPIVI|nr:hypothetical protein T265_06056 [Opisthorchis viverrini]KER26774.1 hypothetical protein T265_06056 [Opisthorchis viverrini]
MSEIRALRSVGLCDHWSCEQTTRVLVYGQILVPKRTHWGIVGGPAVLEGNEARNSLCENADSKRNVKIQMRPTCVGGVVVTRSLRMSDVRGSKPGTATGYALLMSSNKNETRVQDEIPAVSSILSTHEAPSESDRRLLGQQQLGSNKSEEHRMRPLQEPLTEHRVEFSPMAGSGRLKEQTTYLFVKMWRGSTQKAGHGMSKGPVPPSMQYGKDEIIVINTKDGTKLASARNRIRSASALPRAWMATAVAWPRTLIPSASACAMRTFRALLCMRKVNIFPESSWRFGCQLRSERPDEHDHIRPPGVGKDMCQLNCVGHTLIVTTQAFNHFQHRKAVDKSMGVEEYHGGHRVRENSLE